METTFNGLSLLSSELKKIYNVEYIILFKRYFFLFISLNYKLYYLEIHKAISMQKFSLLKRG